MAGGHDLAALGEPERKTSGELEAALTPQSALGKVEIDGFLGRRSGGDHGEVGGRIEAAFRSASHMDAEGGSPAFQILESDAGADLAAGRDVLGQREIDFKTGEAEFADESGDQQ